MQVPLEIAFHNLEKSDWAEAEIRARAEKLEDIYDRIIACRVHVDQRAKTPRSTPPVVRIEVSIPGGKPLIVAYEPHRLQQRYQNPDLRNAINDAFDAAERQLRDLKTRREGRTKAPQHDSAQRFRGEVAEMAAERDHGFLLTKEGSLLYFHRNSVLEGDFDALGRGDTVHYVEEIGDTGPIASKVWVAAG
ncbi:HPF/RaiA family ribosome-associated protein [Aquibium sp. A9E412]|uniref:HPF/RaiA family ribosome-associated protein n=1 Tax=Aquibium sp. A9E412 TaxID=2976767 RepID=UPI0025AEE930|nr:HPF/RaiA family ribosome-associated protein [Aquibium sp. A9E412]MDN2566108.1 HPF/RaiA family ribosome-associated protein [Aquibium sp. A9E412]